MSFGVSDEALLQRAIALAQLQDAEVSFQKIALERARGLTIQGTLANGKLFTRILVSTNETTYWKAFIICHELGHIALHTHYGNVLEINGPLRSKLEREADRFAIKLLRKIRLELLVQRVKSLFSRRRP